MYTARGVCKNDIPYLWRGMSVQALCLPDHTHQILVDVDTTVQFHLSRRVYSGQDTYTHCHHGNNTGDRPFTTIVMRWGFPCQF